MNRVLARVLVATAVLSTVLAGAVATPAQASDNCTATILCGRVINSSSSKSQIWTYQSWYGGTTPLGPARALFPGSRTDRYVDTDGFCMRYGRSGYYYTNWHPGRISLGAGACVKIGNTTLATVVSN